MKKYLLIFMTGIIFLNVFGANEVSAQTLKNIRAEVPFDFRVGERLYPAGVYYLESISQANGSLLQIRSFETKKQLLLQTNELYAAERQSPKLVFYQIGEKYYLTNIFMTEGDAGFSIRTKHRQTEKAKKLPATRKVEVPVKN